MVVCVRAVGQSLAKSYSAAERREIALNYIACAYGTKAGYASSVGVHPTTILDWPSIRVNYLSFKLSERPGRKRTPRGEGRLRAWENLSRSWKVTAPVKTWRARAWPDQQAEHKELIAHEEGIVADLQAAGLSKVRALAVAGVSVSTWYYRHHPPPKAADPTPRHLRSKAKIDEGVIEQINDCSSGVGRKGSGQPKCTTGILMILIKSI